MKDPLAKLPGYVLRRASSAALGELNQRLEPLKLRHADAAFLLLIDRTKVDGRSQALRLTAAGRTMLAKARRVIGSFEAALMNRVPEKMRPMVLPILMALWKGPDF
jgi:hypothetical protein